MARALRLILLLALLAPASCLRCKSCRGEFGCSAETEVTCGEGESSCRTAVRSAAVSFLRFQTVSKGCARRSRPAEAVALSSHLLALSYSAVHCLQDGCNDQRIVAPEPAPPNQLRCHACTSQGDWCPPSARTLLGCTGAQDQCLDLDVTGTLGEFTNMKLKGCASLPRCQDGLGFHTGSRAIHARCCNTPLCNHLDTDFHVAAEPHNGLQCYSCVDEDGNSCTSNSTSTVTCTGHHNMCLEGIGHSRSGGAGSILVTFKGCATPAMCQSSLLALVQELDDAEVYCCTGSLCNTRIMDGKVAEGQPGHPAPTSLPHSPAPTPEPDCILEEEEDVVPVAGGLPPSAGSHGNREAEVESSEGRGWEDGGDSVAGGHPVSHAGGQAITPHPSHVATGGHGTASAEGHDNTGSRDTIGAGEVFLESNVARSTGVHHPSLAATGSPATIVLEGSSRSEPGTGETPENAKEIPAGAGLAHTEDEEEECEEETNYSAQDHINKETFVSASSTDSPQPEHSDGSNESPSHFKPTTAVNAGVFVAEGDGRGSAGSTSDAGSTTVRSSDEVLAAEGAGHNATNSASFFASSGSGTSNATESHAGSARESFMAEGAATSSPDRSTAAPGSPGSQTDAIVSILSRQNESFFSEDKEVGSSSASAAPVSPTGTILATGGARVGSHRGKNKTLCTKRPGVAPITNGLSSRDSLAQGGPTAHAGAPETVAKPGGSLERTEGDRDWPNVSFPISVDTHNSSLRDPPGNASVPGLEEHIMKNASSWIYTNNPVIQGKPRPPYPSGAFGLSGHLSLVTLTLLLTVLLH